MIYQFSALIGGAVSFGIGTIVAAALLVGIIYLLVRKGYQPDTKTRSLTSVEANAA